MLDLLSQPGMAFLVDEAENRDILLHELNLCCRNTNTDIAVISVRMHVMPLVEPTNAFRAYMASLRVIPIPAKLLNFLHQTDN